jgi:hypothetical protein
MRLTQSASSARTEVIQWCKEYGLSQAHQSILEALGFCPGDDLKTYLTEEDWRVNGVLPLEKMRLIAASEEDKKKRSGAAKH